MFEQLAIGTIVIVFTIVIQTIFIGLTNMGLRRLSPWLLAPPVQIKFIFIVVTLVLWLVAGLSINAWMWSVVFLLVGAFDTLEPALYFTTVTFTTVGYGDVTLDKEWRLLGGLAAVNGLIIFGLITAYLVEAITRINKAQTNKKARKYKD